MSFFPPKYAYTRKQALAYNDVVYQDEHNRYDYCPFVAVQEDDCLKVFDYYSTGSSNWLLLARVDHNELKMELRDNNLSFISIYLNSQDNRIANLAYTDFKFTGKLPGFRDEDVRTHCDVWYHTDTIRVSKKKNEHPNSKVGPAIIHVKTGKLEYICDYLEEDDERKFMEQYMVTYLEEYVPPTMRQITQAAAEMLHPHNYDPTGVISFTVNYAKENNLRNHMDIDMYDRQY